MTHPDDAIDEALTEHEARVHHVLNKKGIKLSEEATQALINYTFFGPPLGGDDVGEEQAEFNRACAELVLSDYDPAQEILNREREARRHPRGGLRVVD